MLAQCENSESTIRMKENNWYEWYSKNQMKFRKIKDICGSHGMLPLPINCSSSIPDSYLFDWP